MTRRITSLTFSTVSPSRGVNCDGSGEAAVDDERVDEGTIPKRHTSQREPRAG